MISVGGPRHEASRNDTLVRRSDPFRYFRHQRFVLRMMKRWGAHE